MPDRERRRSSVTSELAALLEAGDNRAASTRARQVLSGDGSGIDRDAALAALARVKPDRAGVLVAAAGFLLLAAAALLGLYRA